MAECGLQKFEALALILNLKSLKYKKHTFSKQKSCQCSQQIEICPLQLKVKIYEFLYKKVWRF